MYFLSSFKVEEALLEAARLGVVVSETMIKSNKLGDVILADETYHPIEASILCERNKSCVVQGQANRRYSTPRPGSATPTQGKHFQIFAEEGKAEESPLFRPCSN